MALGISRLNQYTLFSQLQARRQASSANKDLIPAAANLSENQLAVVSSREVETALRLIVSTLRTLENEVAKATVCLHRLSPAKPEQLSAHLVKLKQNKQKTHDLHFHYTNVCLANSFQHFTVGITPKERLLTERFMDLLQNISKLIMVCQDKLSGYKLLGKIALPRNYGSSLASIKELGGILAEVFDGKYNYQADSFRIDAEQPVYIEKTGEIYAVKAAQLAGKIEQLTERFAEALAEKSVTTSAILDDTIASKSLTN